MAKIFHFELGRRDVVNRDELPTILNRNTGWYPHQVDSDGNKWTPEAIFLLSDKGHDPMQVATAWEVLLGHGFRVHFATEHGIPPECDTKLQRGMLRKMIGSTQEAIETYERMQDVEEFTRPLDFSEPQFTLEPYHCVVVPGGWDKSIVPFLESQRLQQLLSQLQPHLAREAAKNRKVLMAIGQGVLPVARAPGVAGGSAKLLDHTISTTYPAWMEKSDYWSTAMFCGSYVRTYYNYVEDEVRGNMSEPHKLLAGPEERSPYYIVDPDHFYISCRYAGDVQKAALALVKQVQRANGSMRRRSERYLKSFDRYTRDLPDGKLGRPI